MRIIYVFVWTVLLSAGLSSTAWAGNPPLVPTKYDPTKCLGADYNANAVLQRGNKTITNPSSNVNTVNVFCPIVKTTSGPGIINDQIWDANIPVTVSTSVTVNCGIEVYQNEDFIGTQNFVESSWSNVTTSGTMNIGFEAQFSGPNDYWDGLKTPRTWYYANIECMLPPGASIGEYTVDELGTPQPTRIYTASACAPDATVPPSWRYLDYETGNDVRGGGVVFLAQPNVKYVFNCAVSPSNSVEFSVLPDEGSGQTFGCSLDRRVSPQTWPSQTVPTNADVVQTLPLTGSPFIRVPASGSHKLVCDSTPDTGVGDAGLYSFRTEPDWTPSASVSGGGSTPLQAVDLNMGTRWTTGRAQTNGMWFQVDLKSPKGFSSIEMNSTGRNNDYAHGYQVFVSNDGSTWGNPVASGTGTGPVIVVGFQPQTARYIRVMQTRTSTNWWSIYEFTVFK